MSIHTIIQGSDLRAVLGYWDDSAGERVAGTAVAGDTIRLDFTGTYDLGADDNILYPPTHVRILGPSGGALVIQGRLYCQGAGGVLNNLLRLEGWTLDLKGYAAIGASGAPGPDGLGATSGVWLHACSVMIDGWACINSNRATSGTANNLTISCAAAAPIQVIASRHYNSGAAADGISFKSIGGNAPAGTFAKLFDCTAIDPNTAATDQAATSHTLFPLYVYGGYYAGNGSGASIAIGSANGSITEVVNAVCAGKINDVTLVDGSIAQVAWSGAAMTLGGTCAVRHSSIRNFGNATTDYGISLGSGIDLTCEYLDVQGLGSGVALRAPAAGWAGQVAVDHLVASGLYRGVDVRLGGPHSVTDSLISSDNSSILGATGQPTTARNIVAVTYSGISLHASDALRAIEAPELATAREGVQVLARPMPNPAVAISDLLDRGGWPDALRMRYLMLSAGGNLLPSDVRGDTATGQAAGGSFIRQIGYPGVG
jgi:hypothetical protein